MKNLSYLVLALFISVIGFSCSSDEAAEIIKPEQKELISLSLKASLGVDDTETKADDGISYPLNKYLLDYIYLRNGGAETALRIPVSNNDTRDFELNLSTTEDGKIKISSGENSITVADGTMLYFTSVPTDGIEAEAYPANVFETPLGNTVYKEHGRDIYKSEQFPVKIIDEGFEFLKATYYTGTEVNHFRLVMFRLTGVFQARLILFKFDNGDIYNPKDVTAADLPAGDWSVTTFLTKYPLSFNVYGDDKKGSVKQGSELGVYALADRILHFTPEANVVAKHDQRNIIFNTLTATCGETCPYIFNGDLANSTMEYVINDGTNIRIATIPLEIAGAIQTNDIKVVNVCLNITQLNSNNIFPVPLESALRSGEPLPNAFYWFE